MNQSQTRLIGKASATMTGTHNFIETGLLSPLLAMHVQAEAGQEESAPSLGVKKRCGRQGLRKKRGWGARRGRQESYLGRDSAQEVKVSSFSCIPLLVLFASMRAEASFFPFSSNSTLFLLLHLYFLCFPFRYMIIKHCLIKENLILCIRGQTASPQALASEGVMRVFDRAFWKRV